MNAQHLIGRPRGAGRWLLCLLAVGLMLLPSGCAHAAVVGAGASASSAAEVVAPHCPEHAPGCAVAALSAVAVPAPRHAVPDLPVSGPVELAPGVEGPAGAGWRRGPAEVRGGAQILVAIGVSRS
ncbi:hypothetical protein WEH80_09340 [Actinomycetes bacterium KLBMP 9759]